MEIEKIKQLAVPVSERLPEKVNTTYVLFTYKGKEEVGLASYEDNNWYFVGVTYLAEKPVVTHYIDFELLTTKEKALELAKDAWMCGNNYEQWNESRINSEQFITQNKDRL